MADRRSLTTGRRPMRNRSGSLCPNSTDAIRAIMLACLVALVNFSGLTGEIDARAEPVSSSSTSAPATHPAIRGLYTMVSLKKGISGTVADAIKDPNIDGAFIQDVWADVEPEPQRYDWSRLDDQLAKVKSLGKKVSISISAGGSTPQWVYDSGAQSFKTVIVQRKNPQFCEPITIPIPWDPIFLRAWTDFVAAFGRRYANNPSVALIKITGINYHSAETQLPRDEEKDVSSVDGSRTCHIPDQISQWAARGYTSTRIVDAFHTIANAFGRAFPDVPLAIMTGTNAFPALGPDGRPAAQAAFLSTTDSAEAESFLSYGRKTFGARFAAQTNGLRVQFVDPAIAGFSATNPTGYQFDWPVSNDRNCIVGGRKQGCDTIEKRQAVMAKTIDNALRAHAQYLELFPVDIADPSFNEIISDAHRRLWSTAN